MHGVKTVQLENGQPLPRPTVEFRRRAWRVFQAALDRHFGRRDS